MTAPTGGDVLVAGGGPAAWSIAHRLAGHGLDVLLVAPDPMAPWSNTYGAWLDELAELDGGLGPDVIVQRRYDTVIAVGDVTHRLDRTYVVLDNDRLSATLRTAHPVRTLAATVVDCSVRPSGAPVARLDTGEVIESRAVIDATGARSELIRRPRSRGPVAIQAAYGVIARFDRPPAEPGSCVFMDWTQPPGADPGDPTFLYALDRGDGWWLVEETSLARSPSMGQGELRRRLTARLAAAGVTITEVAAEEVVAIPMGVRVPPAQPILAFGAAAGLIHPATGYSVGESLRGATGLAATIATGLRAGHPPATVAAAGWDALWPRERRRVRALQQYGLGVLTRLGAADSRAFFDAFFGLPTDSWARYLDSSTPAAEITSVMWAVFRSAPWSVRRHLLRF